MVCLCFESNKISSGGENLSLHLSRLSKRLLTTPIEHLGEVKRVTCLDYSRADHHPHHHQQQQQQHHHHGSRRLTPLWKTTTRWRDQRIERVNAKSKQSQQRENA